MWKGKVLLAPNREIAELGEKVCGEHGFEGWIFDHGSLDVGVEKALDYAARGAKVIVSRGLSCQTISSVVDIPVVEIEIDARDWLRALGQAAKHARKVGVTGPAIIVSNIRELGELLGLDVEETPLLSFDQILPAIDRLKGKGIGVIVGGQTSVEYANRIGLVGVNLRVSEHSLMLAMRKAENIIAARREEERHSSRGHTAACSFDRIVSADTAMRKLIGQGLKMAAVDSNILITGSTGTGKELFAQSLHNASSRRGRPFVAINCASVPPTLLESELFGYEGGAFTGASRRGKKGYFELADGGTLFLDEIGELPVSFQTHLLRALQEREIMRVGGGRTIPVDVRIISATHKDLHRAVRDGMFRADLYHRLNVLRLQLPPLSQRRGDIPLLAAAFMRRKAAELDLPPAVLTDGAMARMTGYPWEGNVRELENAVERLLVMKSGEQVRCSDLDEFLTDITPPAPEGEAAGAAPACSLSGTLEEICNRAVFLTLEECGGDRGEACRRLGISSTTLWRRLQKRNAIISK